MTSVEGYSAIRFYNSIFYKTPHPGTWDAALSYDANQIFAAFSRGFENWEYASERVHLSPFSWLNAGPDEASEFDDARPPEYVSEQLEAFRKWGTGGEFANYVYGGLDPVDYADYVGAMQDASSPGTVDEDRPDRRDRGRRPGPRDRNCHRQPRDQGGALAGRSEADPGSRRCAGRCWVATTTRDSSGRCAGRCRSKS